MKSHGNYRVWHYPYSSSPRLQILLLRSNFGHSQRKKRERINDIIAREREEEEKNERKLFIGHHRAPSKLTLAIGTCNIARRPISFHSDEEWKNKMKKQKRFSFRKFPADHLEAKSRLIYKYMSLIRTADLILLLVLGGQA